MGRRKALQNKLYNIMSSTKKKVKHKFFWEKETDKKMFSDRFFFDTERSTALPLVLTRVTKWHMLFDAYSQHRYNWTDRYDFSIQTNGGTERLTRFTDDTSMPKNVKEAGLAYLYDDTCISNKQVDPGLAAELDLYEKIFYNIGIESLFPVTNNSSRNSRFVYELLMREVERIMKAANMSMNTLTSNSPQGQAERDELNQRLNSKGTVSAISKQLADAEAQAEMNIPSSPWRNQNIDDKEAGKQKRWLYGLGNYDGITMGGRTQQEYRRMGIEAQEAAEIKLRDLYQSIIGTAYKHGDLGGVETTSIFEEGEILDVASPEHFVMDTLHLLEIDRATLANNCVDVYMDYSGSMAEEVNIARGRNVAKSVAMRFALDRLRKANFIDKVHLFSDKVLENVSEEQLRMADPTNGTNFLYCYEHFYANGCRPSVIISDGCGDLQYYHPNMHFIFIGDQYLHLATANPAMRRYTKNGQICAIFGNVMVDGVKQY